MPNPAPNLVASPGRISPELRVERTGQRGCVVWLTGLSGAGKSTLARDVEVALFAEGFLPTVLDGDNLRAGLCSDLGFSPRDRDENIRRISQVARLFAEAGLITIVAFISPYREVRARARAVVGEHRFLEVHVRASLAVCEGRDPKGLYAKARAGDISDFTGIDAPYEEPESPELVVDTESLPRERGTAAVLGALRSGGFLIGKSEGA